MLLYTLTSALTETSIFNIYGHTDGCTDGHTDGRTDRQADSGIPPKTFVSQGYDKLLKNQMTLYYVYPRFSTCPILEYMFQNDVLYVVKTIRFVLLLCTTKSKVNPFPNTLFCDRPKFKEAVDDN